MNEKKRFVLLIIGFSILSLLINYFCIYSIFDSLEFKKGGIFYVLLFVLSFSYPLTVMMERYRPMYLTKMFYRIASIWIGIAFFSVSVFLIYQLFSIFFNFNKQMGSIIVLSFIALISLSSLINGKRLRINLVDIKIKGLKKDLKIAHLSDLHIGAIHRKKYLEKIIKITNSLNPDVVVVTGDLVDGSTVINKEILSPINKIKAPVYFVIGNHEIYEGLDKIMPLLNKTKMRVLRNEKYKFKEITFVGLDYYESKKELFDNLDKINIDKNKINVLLYHAPRFKLEELEKKGIDLHLTGHTHNGQIFPLNLLVKLLYPYSRGFHKSENSNVVVSVGSGTWGPPMRLGSTSEINLISLKEK